MFNVKLETCGQKYKAKAETIYEALDKIGLSWNEIKNKGVITISQGVGKNIKKHEHLFNTIQLRRIFGNKLTQQLWAKRLETLLK